MTFSFPILFPDSTVFKPSKTCSNLLFVLDTLQGTIPDIKKNQEALSETQTVISAALDRLSSYNYLQTFFACAMCFFVISPIFFPVTQHSPLSLHHAAGKILYLFRLVTTVILSGYFFYLIFDTRLEYSAYKSVKQMIDIQLKQISPRKRMKGNSCL